MELNAKQLEAIETCLDKSLRIVAVTGAAGTGKTTIIRMIADKLTEEGRVFLIGAPTGKAAKRIREATGYNAQTVHKILEFPKPGEINPKTGKPLSPTYPKRGPNYPLTADVILVDEYTMVNYQLNRFIIDALGSGARLLVFGDINQLPPIEEYKTQRDYPIPFAEHLKRNSVTLDTIYRQDEKSGLLYSANMIAKGQMPRQYDDFKMVITSSQQQRLVDMVIKAKKEGIDYASTENQIISPVKKKNWCSSGVLNNILRKILNPNADTYIPMPRHEYDKNEVPISIGDKVVITENIYDLREYNDRVVPDGVDENNMPKTKYIPPTENQMVMNGEVGIVIDMSDDHLTIDLGDRIIDFPHMIQEINPFNGKTYERVFWKLIDLAYVLTTHKTQGSQYENIIYVMSSSMYYMLDRKNFYTAVTRAKKMATVLTDQRALSAALKEISLANSGKSNG